jgi:peptidoglycan/LPS O-acetylase OafA/YrhL/lysophospholipase L1-like esterase
MFSSAAKPSGFRYRASVDGLRGIAILAVLAFHAFPSVVPGGYIGVDVFFVISGFLITSIIVSQLREDRFSFADFYWRRVRRLFPALTVVLIATLLLGWMIMLPNELRQLGKHIIAAAVFMSNIVLWRESGYFDVSAEFKPLLHLWSLGIEEQFYLVWPALLVALRRRRRLLITVVWTLLIASFAFSVVASDWAPVANFYSPASRFWELGAGCLLALSGDASSNQLAPQSALRSRIAASLPFGGLLLIAISMFVLNADTPFPGWAALLPVVGTLMVIATPENSWTHRNVLAWRPLVWVGLISYALYVWHWPLFAFTNILHSGPAPLYTKWLLLFASFVLAWLTYKFIEIPIRTRRTPKINFRVATAAAATGIAGVIVFSSHGFVQRFDSDVRLLRHEARLDAQCLTRIDHDKRINYCRTTSTSSPTILFLGDSRAQAIYEGEVSLLQPDESVMLLGRGGCPPLLNVSIRGYDPNERDCDAVWRLFVDYVQKANPKVVVLIGNGSLLLTQPEVYLMRHDHPQPESNESVFEYGLASLINELKQHSQVIYLREIPTYETAPSCFLRSIQMPSARCDPELDRKEVEQALAPYDRVLQRVSVAQPDVAIVDALDVLCSESVCSQRPAGKPILYSDRLHLSPAGGRLVAAQTQLHALISRDATIADARVAN